MKVTVSYTDFIGFGTNNTLDSGVSENENETAIQNEPKNQDILEFPTSKVSDIFKSDEEQIKRYRERFGLTGNNNVKIFVIPKGCTKIKTGCFLRKQTASVKTYQLSADISSARQKIFRLESGICGENMSDSEKSRHIAALKYDLLQYKSSLSKEQVRLSKIPPSGYVVIERE